MAQTRHQEIALAKPFPGQQLHRSHGEPASDLFYSLLVQSLCHPLGNVPSHLPNEISNQTPKQDKSPPERKQSGLKYVIASGAWVWVNFLVCLWRPLLGKSWIQGNRNRYRLQGQLSNKDIRGLERIFLPKQEFGGTRNIQSFVKFQLLDFEDHFKKTASLFCTPTKEPQSGLGTE